MKEKELHTYTKGGPYEPINVKDIHNKKDWLNLFLTCSCERIKELEEYIEELEEELDKSPLRRFAEHFFNDSEEEDEEE